MSRNNIKLAKETNNFFLLTSQEDISSQKQRLNIAILNLMPTVKETEQHWREVLSFNNNVEANIVFFHSLVRPSSKVEKEHLEKNYYNWKEYDFSKLDGIVITGANVELLKFEEVEFYNEVCEIISRSIKHNLSIMLICWAAQAALYYLYGVNKINLEKKLFGVYEHKIVKSNHPLLKGISEDTIKACISRQTIIDPKKATEFTTPILSSSIDGLDCLEDKSKRIIYMFNHLEYDEKTLEAEFLRDLNTKKIDPPHNYYNDENYSDINYSWENYRKAFYSNWINTLIN